ncbi:unnamed protein product [Ceratitis capitata]|uniref:(Mediterranean fruit fly) hypothetical protein n=1 Tax=Ceratitis capitata TaxID=7213 RepID=A0A811VAZ5_CERCA|nr:unnamed protein product [Ceratitis capitata]
MAAPQMLQKQSSVVSFTPPPPAQQQERKLCVTIVNTFTSKHAAEKRQQYSRRYHCITYQRP